MIGSTQSALDFSVEPEPRALRWAPCEWERVGRLLDCACHFRGSARTDRSAQRGHTKV